MVAGGVVTCGVLQSGQKNFKQLGLSLASLLQLMGHLLKFIKGTIGTVHRYIRDNSFMKIFFQRWSWAPSEYFFQGWAMRGLNWDGSPPAGSRGSWSCPLAGFMGSWSCPQQGSGSAEAVSQQGPGPPGAAEAVSPSRVQRQSWSCPSAGSRGSWSCPPAGFRGRAEAAPSKVRGQLKLCPPAG